MDLRLGRPLPYQQPNPPQFHHKALRFGNSSFQNQFLMEFYPQVSKVILHLMLGYLRVTEHFAGIAT